MIMSNERSSAPGEMKFTRLTWASKHYVLLSLSALYVGEERTTFKGIIHFNLLTKWISFNAETPDKKS